MMMYDDLLFAHDDYDDWSESMDEYGHPLRFLWLVGEATTRIVQGSYESVQSSLQMEQAQQIW